MGRNTGVAFGLFQGYPRLFLFLTIVSLIIILAYTGWTRKMQTWPILVNVAFTFIISGALGNIIDRLIREGQVVDFLDFHWGKYHWPAFNLADSSITCGIILLSMVFLWEEIKLKKARKRQMGSNTELK